MDINQTIDVPMSSLMGRLTLNVRITGVAANRARVAIGSQLIKLAAWVMGVGVHVEVGDAGQA